MTEPIVCGNVKRAPVITLVWKGCATMTSSPRRSWKRLSFRWTAPRGLWAFVLFLLLTFLFEYVLVYSFQSVGLTDKNVLSKSFQIPSTSWSFTLDVSPLFHLLPLSIVVVLVSCWSYLSRRLAVSPWRAEPSTRKPSLIRRKREMRRFRWFKRFFKRVERRAQMVARKVKAAFYRIRGVSYVSSRLFVARAAVKSAVIVLTVFFSVFLLLHVNVFPWVIHDVVVEFYQNNPSFLAFVLGTGEVARGIGRVLSPIGWLGSAVDNALLASASGFRHAFDAVGISLMEPLTKLDVVAKYVVVQNVAAWVSVFLAVIYGVYVSRPYRRARAR